MAFIGHFPFSSVESLSHLVAVIAYFNLSSHQSFLCRNTNKNDSTMWRGFGADSDPEPPAQRSYFRPRISSISGVLAMTKQRLFTSGPIKDEVNEHVPHTASIHPVTSGPSSGPHGNHLLTDQYLLNGGLTRCPSPARSSYGDVMSFSRSASARPSIDSQTAHAI